MYKKHYINVAMILRAEREFADSERDIDGVIFALAAYFARENPRFERETFYAVANLKGGFDES